MNNVTNVNETRKLIMDYVGDDIGLHNFVEAFVKMQQANDDGFKTRLTARVGKSEEDGFLLFLKSNIENPRILLSYWEQDVGSEISPQVIVCDNFGVVLNFMLNDVKFISSHIEICESCNFDRYNFTFNVSDKFDYNFTILIYKKKGGMK